MKRFAVAVVAALIVLIASGPVFGQAIDHPYYTQAESLYNKGQYEKAKQKIAEALKLQNVKNSPEYVKAFNSLRERCNVAIAKRDRLSVDVDSLYVGYSETEEIVRIDAGQPSKVTVTSGDRMWCNVELMEDGNMRVVASFNPDKNVRSTVVTVKMGNVKTIKIPVKQEARPDTRNRVVISTIPAGSTISIDDAIPVGSPYDLVMASGDHRIVVEKSGYAKIDTLIRIKDDMSNNTMDLTMKLKPLFALMSVDIKPEEGFQFEKDGEPLLTINGEPVNINPKRIRSFDDDSDVMKYQVYRDSTYQNGVIPVTASRRVRVTVSAKNYKDWVQEFSVENGQTLPVSVVMEPVTGYLSLFNDGRAEDAMALVDGKEIGPVQSVSRYRTMVGQHELTLRKPGHMSDKDIYPLRIKSGQDTTVFVSMTRFRPFIFNSEQEGVKVFVDGELAGTTSDNVPVFIKEKDYAGTYYVRSVKPGYHSFTYPLSNIDFSRTDTAFVEIKMRRAYPLRIVTDEPGQEITIKDNRDSQLSYCDSSYTPADLLLPLKQDGRYFIEMKRPDNSLSYRGHLKFKSENTTLRYYQTYSKHYFHIAGLDFFLPGMPHKFEAGEVMAGNAKQFRPAASLHLLKFRLFGIPGLSSSFAKATFFSGVTADPFMVAPKSGGTDDIEGNSILGGIPAISALLINEEFRIGGAIFGFADINALVTYTWYPDLWRNVGAKFSYMSGHDVFVGAEISSRAPVFNASVRMGYQMYPGLKAHIFPKDGDASTYSSATNLYLDSYPVNIPGTFVISVSFTLGTMDSKGNNICRVFYP